MRIGEWNKLKAAEFVANGLFLTDGKDVVMLPSDEVPEGTQVGDRVKAFVFKDTDDLPVATRRRPRATVGEFAVMEVVDAFPHGVFVDWGLDKDLMVPHKEQPDRGLAVGQRAVIYVRLHERTQRPIGCAKLGKYLDYEPDHFKPNHEVEVMVYGFNESGAHLIVDGRYRGMAYHNEIHEQLQIGDVRKAWVKEVREDGRLDISLQRLGHGATLDAKDVILEAVDAAGGFLPLHDKSKPKDIRDALQMSKGVFKKAIGVLYRERRIVIEPTGIRRS